MDARHQQAKLSDEDAAATWHEAGESGFHGPAKDLLEVQLVRHVLDVYPNRIRSGQVFMDVAALGRPLSKPSWLALDDAKDITQDILERHLPEFWEDARCGKSWDPSKRRNLLDYFVGFCNLKFNNAFKRHETQRKHSGNPQDHVECRTNYIDWNQTYSPTSELYDAQIAVDHHFPNERGKARLALILTALGWPSKMIANKCGMKLKALNSMFDRIRKRNRRTGGKNEQ